MKFFRIVIYSCIYTLLNATYAATVPSKNIDSVWAVANNIKEADTTRLKAIHAVAWNFIFSNPDTSLVFAKMELQLAQEKKLKDYESKAYNTYGVIYKNKSDYPRAMEYFLRCLKIDTELKNKKGMAVANNNIGIIHKNQGDYPKALGNYLRSLKLYEEINHKKGVATALNNIGIIYDKLTENEKALDYYTRAMKINEEQDDKEGMANSLNNIALISKRMLNYPKALECHERSLKLYEEIDNKRGMGMALGNMGLVYMRLNQPDRALDFFSRSLKIDEEIGNIDGVVAGLGAIGGVYLKQKDYKKALPYNLKALTLVQETGNISLEKDIQNDLYTEYKATGNIANALKHYERYTLLRDSIFKEENQKEIMQKQMQFDFDKKEAVAKVEQEKERSLAAAESKKQRLVILFIACGLVLVIAIAIIILRSLRITKKQKAVIEQQKQEVDKKNSLLNAAYQELHQQNKEISAQRDEIRYQKLIVEEHQKEIIDSINYARRIQFTLLANKEVLQNNLQDHFVLFKPKDIVSGDFYWALQKENRFYIAACDCTGHGVPGAFMSLLNISFLNEAVNEKNIVAPNEILNHVRQRLIASVSQEGGQDGMDAVLFCIDKASGSVSYAAANNAPTIIKNGELVSLDTDKMPVGKGERMDSFSLRKIELQKGDAIYLYTDGYADQFGGPKGKKFMYKKLEEMLLGNSGFEMEKQKETLLRAFQEWKGNVEQIDDVLVMGVRV